MAIQFKEEGHVYESIGDEKIDWLSVTSFISMFKPKFDGKAQAKKSSKNKRSKWYGMTPKDIITAWDNESQRAIKLGNFYHNQREKDLLDFKTIEREGCEVPIIKPLFDEEAGIKIAPEQKLSEGLYPEHMVYLKSAGICGQSDLVEIVNGKVNIIDYKTNKEIKKESYVNWEGISDKMNTPISNLDDCNFNHYALQLSIYMYIILKHNPKLRPGKIFLHHISFEKEGENKWGYPISKKDINGDPIVKDVNVIPIPYLIDEVLSIFHYLNDNKNKIKKK